MVFVGREHELASLEAQYDSNHFELAIVYGRRRVGKTYLLHHFLASHDGAYMVGLESGASNNLEALSQAVYRATGMVKSSELQSTLPNFPTITAALTHLFEYSVDHRCIFIIDEYPYLAESIPSVSSELQALIDAYKDRSQLMLILCGSSMSFMENQVLGHKSPLYGRRTAQYKIKPFTYIEARQMVAHLSYEDSAIAFGLTGGVAEYLSYFRDGDSLDESIISLFFTPTGRLVDEPSSLLKQELREPRQYNAILSAIAKGASRNNEIATKVDFETMAAQYVQARIHRGTVPFLPQQIGHWWGTDTATRKQVEIDVVAMADIQADPNARPVRHLLVGECKWKNEPVGQDVLVSLMEKARVLHGEPYYWLFSKRGFGFISDDERVELIDIPKMYET